MAQTDVILPVEPAADLPVIRSIGLADLRDALAKGLDDFRAMPTHAVFLCLIYPIVGVALGSATFGYDAVPLLYPLASGFALLGPFAAIGLYELSRRRELGLDTSWKHAPRHHSLAVALGHRRAWADAGGNLRHLARNGACDLRCLLRTRAHGARRIRS